MDDRALIEEVSPNGNVLALVEQDERCAYFYLQGAPGSDFGVRSCWVRNLVPAPEALDAAQMREGQAPLLPRAACAHPDGAPRLGDDLRIVWFEEGDAAALLERGELLAVIPSWSGVQGFEGYARDCTAPTPLAWPLAADNPCRPRVARAREFWLRCEDSSLFAEVRERVREALEKALGPAKLSQADTAEWPPLDLVRLSRGADSVVSTTNASFRPQPRAERTEGVPRRIELALAIDSAYLDRNPRAVLAGLAALARTPWKALSGLGPGSVVPSEAIPMTPKGVRFPALLLTRDPPGAPEVRLPPCRGDEVQLLWTVPITEAERKLAESAGPMEVARRLAAAGHGWVHRYRDPVA